ncbi:MAG: GNAT family N-acetyltransferase [Actinomycetota bacterium]|nr:GNAT family N-acetyltransferase [Actinomycetota bacterium]
MTRAEIRLAVPDDLQAILDLSAEDAIRAFDEPTTPTDNQRAALAEIIGDPVHDLLVGEVDGHVVTTAHVSWLRVLMYDGGLMCQIESVRTTAAMRGQGIGNQLMAHIEAEARRRGAARMQLTTNKQRLRAHEFYQRLGFTPSHTGMKKILI